jgi:hypothetical protein
MIDWKHRLKNTLEPILKRQDPRPQLSAYHNMPCAIFYYPPEDEWHVRQEVAMLRTRLEQAGKRVTTISLAECLQSALQAENMPPETLAQMESTAGIDATVETIHSVLTDYRPLDKIVADRLPSDPDPLRDVVFIQRTGAMFGLYRAHTLLEQLMGRITLPGVLFYPGTLDGVSGLSFMGVLAAEANYRPRIF